MVTACLPFGNSLSQKTIAFFLTQGPEGVQLTHDRQGLCKDRWVLGADPAYVEVGFFEHVFGGGDISVALETRDDLSVFPAPGHLSPACLSSLSDHLFSSPPLLQPILAWLGPMVFQ